MGGCRRSVCRCTTMVVYNGVCVTNKYMMQPSSSPMYLIGVDGLLHDLWQSSCCCSCQSNTPSRRGAWHMPHKTNSISCTTPVYVLHMCCTHHCSDVAGLCVGGDCAPRGASSAILPHAQSKAWPCEKGPEALQHDHTVAMSCSVLECAS